MAPKRHRSRTSSSSTPDRFLSTTTRENYLVIKEKGVIQERAIHFPNITSFPQMQKIADSYGWMHFNNMIWECNMSWVEEFYANTLAYDTEDFRSYVRGVEINYTPPTIDEVFQVREEPYSEVQWRRAVARVGTVTAAEFD
jgi:hypothetical protein